MKRLVVISACFYRSFLAELFGRRKDAAIWVAVGACAITQGNRVPILGTGTRCYQWKAK
jgi:hypothetical protein